MNSYAAVDELEARGAIVHTCAKNQDQLNECIREWNEKGFKVLVQAVTYPLIPKEKLMEASSMFYVKLTIPSKKLSPYFYSRISVLKPKAA